ncbi:MAG: hypothetical protein RL318_1633 [Fibrobacterota bacterium]|jgi:dipeptidyl aminopeptidase/acylaminoacyl peptidase
MKPLGLRPSPFTPARMGMRLRLEDVQWLDARTLVWLEGRTDRGALVLQTGSEAPRDLDAEGSVRAGVGYGGGDFSVGKGAVLFVPRGGAVSRRTLRDNRTRALHPGFGGAASPKESPDGRWVLFVHHFNGIDLLACVDSRGARWPIDLARGADFYMQPCWSPDGKQIAWIEWMHPQMPWDGTILKIAKFHEDTPRVEDVRILAGSTETPVFQPMFSPDGTRIAWIEGQEEADALVVLELGTGEKRTLLAETGLLPPAWVQGMRTCDWAPDSQSLVLIRNHHGVQSLVRVSLEGVITAIPAAPYTAFGQICVSPSGEIAVIASSPSIPERILRQSGQDWLVVRRSDPEDVAHEDLPIAIPVNWTSSDGALVHGLYFPPVGDNPDAELPPLLVNIHGGPTSQRLAGWSADTAFFTTRGWAVLEVNHRGSTGYGRSYQRAMDGLWGEIDVQDVAEGTQAIADQGLCDPRRMAVKGGSAGGFTVLRLLTTRPGLFKAGVSLYGVSNLLSLAEDTHKFEERYLDRLLAPLPQGAEIYRNRSPLRQVDRIRDCLALFQGSEDRVVPPSQSESIAKALAERNVPHLYRLYPGEGHGWRKSETIQEYYGEMEKFLREHVVQA